MESNSNRENKNEEEYWRTIHIQLRLIYLLVVPFLCNKILKLIWFHLLKKKRYFQQSKLEKQNLPPAGRLSSDVVCGTFQSNSCIGMKERRTYFGLKQSMIEWFLFYVYINSNLVNNFDFKVQQTIASG